MGDMESSADGVGNLARNGKIQIPGERKRSWSGTLSLGSGESLRAGQSPSLVWAGATHFNFPIKVLRVRCGYFEHQRRVQFEGCVSELLQTITAILPGSKGSRLLQRIVLRDALGDVTIIYPPKIEGVHG